MVALLGLVMTTPTKPDWETAWEQYASEAQQRRLMITPRNQHERDRRIDDEIERNCFQAGFGAHASQSERAIREARAEGWAEGYERAMNDRDASDWTETPETRNPYAPEETK